ncbi:ABC transporter substrate-binding protein [Bifidobacterium stellenboschense]|uniref:ABC transporter substrate-binding protein n=1 Tax=Bifidobacterium stellenboschense TaxID=762211 RepID=A0A087DBR1_9BIFI|nr:extracellular solute-binding protein [Bifidobacterium stellenboschense]KFI92961.1 ABC transporter substrate-binding protein [Bifidobacterium stellenboschense]
MKFSKMLVAAAATVAMIVPLAACGGGAADSGKTTITYFSWNNEKMMSPIVKAFEEANPDIKVEMSAAQGQATDYAQTLTTRVAGGQVPDVFHMSIETRNEVLDAGLARDITNEDFVKNLPKSQTDLYTRDGKVYGMSPTAWIGGIVYNKDLLKEVGYDSVPETLDEFIDLGKKLQEKNITPYMEDMSVVSGSFQPMLGGYYAKQGIETSKWPELDEGGKFSEQWTPVLKQWTKLVDSGTLPKETVGVSADQIKQNFMTGQLAMFRSGPWDFADLDSSGVDYGVAAFPAVDGGQPYVGGGPDSPFVISSKAEGAKLDAAKKFVAFMNSEAGLKLEEKYINQISVSPEYKADVAPQLKDLYDKYITKGDFYWSNWSRDGNVMGQEMASQFQLLVQGQASVDDVTKALDAKWTESK